MKIGKKVISILFIFIMLLCTVSAVNAYTGTGFSHDIPYSKYSETDANSILSAYNNTNCHVEKKGTCTKIVDGDTIYVDGVGKVRFVGVNTPEKGVVGGDVSKYFVEKLCLNKEVGLDIDDSKNQDKYGRYLAVVIVNGKNLNEMLLKEGLAEVMYMPPSEFYPYSWTNGNTPSHNTQSTATVSNAVNSDSSGIYIASLNSKKFHNPSCKWGQKISENNKITFNSRQEAINSGYEPCKSCNP